MDGVPRRKIAWQTCALALLLLALFVTSVAAAGPPSPPKGHFWVGMYGASSGSTDAAYGRHHLVTWSSLHVDGPTGSLLQSVGALYASDQRYMAHIALPAGMATASVAGGAHDAWLVATSRSLNEAGVAAYVRPMAEMDGHWNPWCAFTESGHAKGKAYSTAAYRSAFRRIAIVMRGGTRGAIDGRLRAAGLHPLRGEFETIVPSGRIGVVWNPQGQGSPNVRGNQPSDYWPGDAYVDVVGNDLYLGTNGRAYWPGLDVLYAAHARKPFLLAEWGSLGGDSPAFVHQVFTWARSHPRTIGLIGFDTGRASLRARPKMRAAYRAELRGKGVVTNSVVFADAGAWMGGDQSITT